MMIGAVYHRDCVHQGSKVQYSNGNIYFFRYVVLMSGLNLASKSGDHLFSLNLFLEWLSGFCGTSQYQEEMSKVVKVIIAGMYKYIKKIKIYKTIA